MRSGFLVNKLRCKCQNPQGTSSATSGDAEPPLLMLGFHPTQNIWCWLQRVSVLRDPARTAAINPIRPLILHAFCSKGTAMTPLGAGAEWKPMNGCVGKRSRCWTEDGRMMDKNVKNENKFSEIKSCGAKLLQGFFWWRP